MKLLALGFVSLALWNFSAHGQADVMVRERAKNLANQNNARQGAPAQPAPSAPPAVPMTATATAPRPASVQQQNLAKLKADLANVRQEGKATDAAKQEFARDLQAVAQGKGQPTKTTLSSLADHLLTAVAAKSVPASLDDKLVSKLQVLLNSGGLPASRSKEIAGEAQTALQNAGLAEDAASKIAADLETIATEVDQSRR